MSQRPAILAHHGRRVLLYLAGSAVLLLGTWLAFRPGAPDLARPPPRPELEFVGGVQPAAADPVRRLAADTAPADTPVAAPSPLIASIPEHELPPERRAALANPVPQIIIHSGSNSALEAARAAATAELQTTLDNRRSALRRACGGKGNISPATLHVQANFGPDGALLGHLVEDLGKTPELRECVQAQPFAMKIPPPGAPMSVRATIAFP